MAMKRNIDERIIIQQNMLDYFWIKYSVYILLTTFEIDMITFENIS